MIQSYWLAISITGVVAAAGILIVDFRGVPYIRLHRPRLFGDLWWEILRDVLFAAGLTCDAWVGILTPTGEGSVTFTLPIGLLLAGQTLFCLFALVKFYLRLR
ncbi:MAG: hypothetical protein ACRETG_09935 [Steroidobacteraceae bacterium]